MSSLLHVSFVPFIYRTSAPLRVHRCNRRLYSTIYDYGAIKGEVCTSVLFHYSGSLVPRLSTVWLECTMHYMLAFFGSCTLLLHACSIVVSLLQSAYNVIDNYCIHILQIIYTKLITFQQTCTRYNQEWLMYSCYNIANKQALTRY